MSDIPCPAADGSSARRTEFPAAPPMCIDPAKSYTAEMVTTLGTMVISLDAASAPMTVNNFVFLAGDGASYLAATTIFADGGIMHSSPGL